jgi:hypothetical protein
MRFGEGLSEGQQVSVDLSGAKQARTLCPALLSVLSKVVAFAIFGAQILRNKQSASGDKSTARSAL